jgi:GDPmannose 4,6-dehydratase
LYGGLKGTEPQNELTPFAPRSPYGAAKLYAFWVTANYRDAYGLHASNGILFNHESPRRGATFVTRKITLAAAAIAKGKLDVLRLGNLSAERDWGYAKEYVEMMWLMLQQPAPGDYVAATGKSHTVRDFAAWAFAETGVDLEWTGEGVGERGVEAKTGKTLVVVDPRYHRPSEVDVLRGDAAKAERVLGWSAKTFAPEIARMMAAHDLANA